MIFAHTAETQSVTVPNVVGMTVKAASAKLKATGLKVSGGTVYVPTVKGGPFTFMHTSRSSKRVTAQTTLAGATVPLDTVVELFTIRGAAQAAPVQWQSLSFSKGVLRVTASHGAACSQVDHVTIAGGSGPRLVSLWSFPNGTAGCSLRPLKVAIKTDTTWTSKSLATPFAGSPATPDASLTPESKARYSSAIVEPDRRHILVQYAQGGCNDEGLQSDSATVSGSTVTIKLQLGDHPPTQVLACPAIALIKWTMVTADAPIPKGATLKADV